MELDHLLVLDRSITEWLNHNRIPALDKIFIFTTDTVWAVPLIMAISLIWLLSFRVKDKLKVKLVLAIVTFSFNTIVITVIKYAIGRQRPYINDHFITKMTSGGSPSFPSGHTADAFIMAIITSHLFPEKKWLKLLIWLWAITIAYTRVALGVHYLSDVIGAAIISCFIGIYFTRVFETKFYPNRSSFSI